MSEADKTLKETIGEALGGNNDTATATAVETEKGLSQEATSDETKSGETPEFVAGIDISDIPEQERVQIKPYLEKKAKLLEQGYQPKFQEVATLKKAMSELTEMGLSTDEARDVLVKYAEEKKNPLKVNAQKKEAIKTLDKLMDTAPREQRESLEQLKTIILEETDIPTIRQELNDLKKAMGFVSQSAYTYKQKEIENQLDTVYSQKFGKDFIDKYRDKIVNVALKYPNENLSKIIKVETPDEEYEQAILLKGRKPLTKEKKDAITSSGNTVSSSTEKVDVKKTSMKDLILNSLKK